MNWTLEVVAVPVTDVERAKSFYRDQVGFRLDHDTWATETMRVVQLTPPGSACSIVVGIGLIESAPGSLKGLQLVVPDIEAARAHLVEHGVAVSEIQQFSTADGGTFVFFDDPDGNGWAVQEIRARARG
ncbi:VOC family protein [Salinactinospora qingdaonensis]|uniref:VOC family protein n=1 Tax=Salinactinospora qingdaonensis TaxID=702744 RepID=A0ABP7FV60_9ACTN